MKNKFKIGDLVSYSYNEQYMKTSNFDLGIIIDLFHCPDYNDTTTKYITNYKVFWLFCSVNKRFTYNLSDPSRYKDTELIPFKGKCR